MGSNVCVSVFVVFVTFASNSDSCTPLYGVRIQAYDNKKISQSVMWTMNNLTKAECLAECYKEKYCLSVHFSPLEPACVALRERFDGVSEAAADASGYQLFQTKKPPSVPGSDCDIDVNCVSLSNSHCHEGICRCDIGYGPHGTICRILTECAVFADSLTLYAGYVIGANDIRSDGGVTREVCQQNCLGNPNCESADYDFVSNYCYQQQKTWFDVAAADQLPSATFDFYQRDCNLWD